MKHSVLWRLDRKVALDIYNLIDFQEIIKMDFAFCNEIGVVKPYFFVLVMSWFLLLLNYDYTDKKHGMLGIRGSSRIE